MEQEDAKSRLRRVVGEEGVRRLNEACVAVFGIGGVGSNCAEALVRGGVGTLIFIDRDEVSLSNINRQVIAYMSTIGRPKVDVMADMARDINPDARIYARQAFVLEDIGAALEGFPRPDIVVDAVDTVTTKLALAHYAQAQGITEIASMGGANKLDPTKLRFADLYQTEKCPLCRAMRKQARKEGIESLTVLYSCEQPVKVAEQEGALRRERTELGTMSYLPPIMGQMIASWVIRRILGLGE